MTDIQHVVFAALKPRVIYSPVDAAREAGVKPGQARYALSRLARGGGSGNAAQQGRAAAVLHDQTVRDVVIVVPAPGRRWRAE